MATNKWMKFFTDAGLPSHVAANYSIIFTENRMDVDMLMDLTKEYLYDMGIRLMGDVIAILRHARTAYTEAAQERILTMSEVKQNADYAALSTDNLVDHYLKKARLSSSIAPQRAQLDFSSVMPVKKKMISLKRRPENDVHGRKLRIIDRDKMEVQFSDLDKVQTSSSAGKSVFNRLGESSVSSSTDAVSRKGSSIFARLGPNRVKTTVESSTVDDDYYDDDDLIDSNEDTVQYQSKIRTNIPHQESRDLRSRLGSKPISAVTVTTTSPDPLRLIRKTLEDTRNQRRLMDANPMASRSNFGQRANVHRRLLNLQPTSTSPMIRKTINVPARLAANRIVKKPKNEKTIFDRLGPAFQS